LYYDTVVIQVVLTFPAFMKADDEHDDACVQLVQTSWIAHHLT